MTLEEAIKHEEEIVKEEQYEYQECVATHNMEGAMNCRKYAEEHRQLAEWLNDYKRLLEQEPSREFAKWVAEEVIDEELWELNYGAFAELACRKLEKLGIVRAKDDEWELVESQEGEEEE